MSEEYTFDEIEAAARKAGIGAGCLESLRNHLVSTVDMTGSIGIYNDLGPFQSIRQTSEISDLGLDEEAIMLETSRRDFDPRWRPADYEQYHGASPDRPKALVVWPEPTSEWFSEFTRLFPPFLETPTFAVDFDAEVYWKEKYVEGFSSLREAGEELMSFARDLKQRGLIKEIQADTFPGHVEAHGNDKIDGEDFFYLQSYAINKEGRTYDGRLGPRRRAEEDAEFVRKKGQDEPMGVVLAAWAQRWPGHTRVEAMKDQAESALRGGYLRYRWWSLKHIVGPRSHEYNRIGMLAANKVLRGES